MNDQEILDAVEWVVHAAFVPPVNQDETEDALSNLRAVWERRELLQAAREASGVLHQLEEYDAARRLQAVIDRVESRHR